MLFRLQRFEAPICLVSFLRDNESGFNIDAGFITNFWGSRPGLERPGHHKYMRYVRFGPGGVDSWLLIPEDNTLARDM